MICFNFSPMRSLRVAVGMSGGVDSAVSAWLLKKKGLDVVGVYMVNWDPQEEGTSQCSRTRDEADARRVCERLEIPFRTVNFVQQYWNEVFVGMLENYRRGRTVVPDIQCNRSIKFNHLHNYAINELGADYIATGHYASTSIADFRPVADTETVRLLKAADPLKDQTFFLCSLRQWQLRRAIFPLGRMVKTRVRQIAKEQGLDEVANKPESMGICFVGKRKNFDEFMDQYVEARQGEIVTSSGDVIGSHRGVHHFTLGKRVPVHSGSHLGYFVADLDAEKNTVIVCEGSHHPSLYAREFLIQEPEWIADNPIDGSPHCSLECRIQRTHPPVPCLVERRDGWLKVTPRLPLRAVAAGQMCVFYKGDECLGGGEVERILTTLADQ